MPLIFGVQRFSSSAGAPANMSNLQTSLTGSMPWASGRFISTGGSAVAENGAQGGRRLAHDIAEPIFHYSLYAGKWIAETSNDPDWLTTASRFGDAAYNAGRRLASKGGSKGDGGDDTGKGGGGSAGSIDTVGCSDWGSGEGSGTGCESQVVMSTVPTAYATLVDSVISFCMAIPFLAGLQLFCIWYWRFRMNRKFYQELLLPPPLNVDDEEPFTLGRRRFWFCGPRKKKKKKKSLFIAFPGIFVFPSILTLGVVFFATGFVGTSLEIVFECNAIFPDDAASRYPCMAPGITVLTLIGIFMLVNFTILMHFHMNFRKAAWAPIVMPDHPDGIEDPLFRLVSRIRYKFCGKCRDPQRVLLERERGEFVRRADKVEEPTRTERLLANPYIIYRDCASDQLDALKLCFMNRASGASFLGVTYDFVVIVAQWMVALANGFGPSLKLGSPEAFAQMIVVITIQWGTASYIALLQPSVDRVDAIVMSVQFFCEGGMTLSLIMGSIEGYDEDFKAGFQQTAFILSMVAMAAPIAEKFYDAVIVQVSKMMRKEDFSWANCVFAMLALVVLIPGIIAAALGVEMETGDIEGVVDEATGAAEDIGDDVQEGLGALGMTSNAFSDLAWVSRPLPRHHRAAVTIQRFREKKMLKQRSDEHRAAARIQAAARGKRMRDTFSNIQKQMPESIRDMRRKSSRMSVKGAQVSRMASLEWIDREERKDLVQERLARARLSTGNRARSFSRNHSGTRMVDDPNDKYSLQPITAANTQANARKFASVDSKLAPGVSSLRDVVVEGVGIVYTRARPAGREDFDELRVSAARMKRRQARLTLPNEMPPRPPTVSGAGSDFADVVRRAQLKDEQDPLTMIGDLGNLGMGVLGAGAGMLGAVGLSKSRSSGSDKSPDRSSDTRGVSFGADNLPQGTPRAPRDEALDLRSALRKHHGKRPANMPPPKRTPRPAFTPEYSNNIPPGGPRVLAPTPAPAVVTSTVQVRADNVDGMTEHPSRSESLAQRARASMGRTRAATAAPRPPPDGDMGV